MSRCKSPFGASLSRIAATILFSCAASLPAVTVASATPVASGTVVSPSQSYGYSDVIYTVPANVQYATITATATWDDSWLLQASGQASSPNLAEVPFQGGSGCNFIRNYPTNNSIEFNGITPFTRDATQTASITVGPGKSVAIAGSDCYVGDNFPFPTVMNWSVDLHYADTKPDITEVSSEGGAEGSAIALNATVLDDGVSPVTYVWSYAAGAGVDPGATCSFGTATGSEDATLTCTDDGAYHVTLTATDAAGSDERSVDVTVTNARPLISSTSFPTGNLTCGTDNASLALSFSDPASNDSHVADIDWGDGSTSTIDPATSPLNSAHTYGTGAHNASVVVTDDDGGVSTASTASVRVNYETDGILQPINSTGRASLFKYGSTIPVKIKIHNCDGTIVSDLQPTISVKKTSGSTPEGIDETGIFSTSGADTGTNMRFSNDGGIYIYNLATSSLSDPTAAYQVTITIQPGQTLSAPFGLKK